LLCDTGMITVKELPPEVAGTDKGVQVPVFSNGNGAHHAVGAGNGNGSYNGNGHVSVATANGDNSPIALHEVERQQIIRALEQTNWHRGKTAELLGISPSTLYRRLREYNLDN
jgi:transcriptional regulator of acetoin/glycerol metabolism